MSVNIKLFPMKGGEEYIVCSAIWVQDNSEMNFPPKNISKGFVATGLRHHHCFEVLAKLYGWNKESGYPQEYQQVTKVQGFITSKNRFVDRKEAMEIALRVGQVLHPIGHENLYSEDLY